MPAPLPSTRRLLHHLARPAAGADAGVDDELVQALVNATLHAGSRADARAALTHLLAHPHGPGQDAVLAVLERWPDPAADAPLLFGRLLAEGRLPNPIHSRVLRTLACLRYEPVRSVLLYYAFAAAEGTDDAWAREDALRGLLHFDWPHEQARFRAAIASTYGRPFFDEYLPLLVCLLPDAAERQATLARFYELGCHCSSDCNRGLLEALARCGAEGESYFRRALFNPHWEAHAGATGSARAAYQGTRRLGIALADLYGEVLALPAGPGQRHALRVWLTLVLLKASPWGLAPDDFPAEPFGPLLAAAFDPGRPASRPGADALASYYDRESWPPDGPQPWDHPSLRSLADQAHELLRLGLSYEALAGNG